MIRHKIGACSVLLVFIGSLAAFEAVGTIKKVDAEQGILVVDAGGRERRVKVAPTVKVFDAGGSALADGLKAKELKEGAVATFTIEPVNNEPFIQAIRLGKAEAAPAGGKATVGFKPLTEMTAQDRYHGEDGGLYGGGKNEPPRRTWLRPAKSWRASHRWMRMASQRRRARSSWFPSACRTRPRNSRVSSRSPTRTRANHHC